MLLKRSYIHVFPFLPERMSHTTAVELVLEWVNVRVLGFLVGVGGFAGEGLFDCCGGRGVGFGLIFVRGDWVGYVLIGLFGLRWGVVPALCCRLWVMAITTIIQLLSPIFVISHLTPIRRPFPPAHQRPQTIRQPLYIPFIIPTIHRPFRPITRLCHQVTLQQQIILLDSLDLGFHKLAYFLYQTRHLNVLCVLGDILPTELLELLDPWGE